MMVGQELLFLLMVGNCPSPLPVLMVCCNGVALGVTNEGQGHLGSCVNGGTSEAGGCGCHLLELRWRLGFALPRRRPTASREGFAFLFPRGACAL